MLVGISLLASNCVIQHTGFADLSVGVISNYSVHLVPIKTGNWPCGFNQRVGNIDKGIISTLTATVLSLCWSIYQSAEYHSAKSSNLHIFPLTCQSIRHQD